MTDQRKRVSSGSSFEKIAGYSRAVVDGDLVFVAGTTGFDYATMTLEPEIEAQTHQTFRNIAAALAEAGATLDDVVRVRYYLTNADDFQKVAPIFGQYLGKARPAATALICALVDPAMRIEIEVTAKKH